MQRYILTNIFCDLDEENVKFEQLYFVILKNVYFLILTKTISNFNNYISRRKRSEQANKSAAAQNLFCPQNSQTSLLNSPNIIIWPSTSTSPDCQWHPFFVTFCTKCARTGHLYLPSPPIPIILLSLEVFACLQCLFYHFLEVFEFVILSLLTRPVSLTQARQDTEGRYLLIFVESSNLLRIFNCPDVSNSPVIQFWPTAHQPYFDYLDIWICWY